MHSFLLNWRSKKERKGSHIINHLPIRIWGRNAPIPYSQKVEEFCTMAKTIQEQIAEMEARCNQLEGLQKLFEKAVKNEFGIDSKKIHKMIHNQNISSNFIQKIATYFCLKTDEDFADFLTIFCTESSLDYFISKRTNKDEA